MPIKDTYLSLDIICTHEIKIKNSKFIAVGIPFTDETQLNENLAVYKKEFPKANHYCYAYRIGIDGATYRANDDGEPSGTAGRPILNTLLSHQMSDILVIVIRYFGGTKLGTSGLIQAYKDATEALIKYKMTIIEKTVTQVITLTFDYTDIGRVMSALDQAQLQWEEADYGTVAMIKVRIRLSEVETQIARLKSFITGYPVADMTTDFLLEGIEIAIYVD